jgi:hypothetical protein
MSNEEIKSKLDMPIINIDKRNLQGTSTLPIAPVYRYKNRKIKLHGIPILSDEERSKLLGLKADYMDY